MLHLFKLTFIAFVILVLGIMLAPPEYSYANSFFQVLALYLWSYFGHILAHKLAHVYPSDILNTHIFIHHDTTDKYSRTLNLASETLNNFMGFYIILIIQFLLGITLFSTKIVLFSALSYIFVHIGYYSLFKNNYHIQHHKTPEFNYSPELLDTIFQTKYNHDYTNDLSVGAELLPIIGAFIIVSLSAKLFSGKGDGILVSGAGAGLLLNQ